MYLRVKRSSVFLCLLFASAYNLSLAQSSCCGKAFRLLGITDFTQPEDTCLQVGIKLQNRLANHRTNEENYNTPTPRDLQSKKANTPNSVAALNQSDAAPALYPFALAGGSVGGTGSDAGTNALTTLSLNPAIFFADMDNTEESAKWGRVMDVSAILPLNEIQSGTTDKLSYLGLRARINVDGAMGKQDLLRKVDNEFNNVITNSFLEQERIIELINNAPNCERCIKALKNFVDEGFTQSSRAANQSSLEAACKAKFEGDKGDVIFENFESAVEAVLKEADKQYWGFELRGDFGDPTLGAIDSARGTSLYWGGGFGKTFSGKRSSAVGLRLNAGFRYKDMYHLDANIFDIEGAGGFDITWPYQYQEVKIGVGFEFRTNIEKNENETVGMDIIEAYETDYFFIRTSLNIPVTNANSFSLQYGTALVGEKSSVLSLNFNWKLLLED